MPKLEEYQIPASDVLSQLDSGPEGLSSSEAGQRLIEYGKNILPIRRRKTALDLFISQFKDFMVIILLVAAVVSFFLGEILDASVIAIIMLLNAILGFIQEYNAERAIDELQKLAAPMALVLRDGKQVRIPSEDLVPGDIIHLEIGEKIPADSRIIESINFEVDESILTGESHVVAKISEPVEEASVIGDRINMVFMGTTVSSGRAYAIVTKTGAQTEIGRVSELVQTVEEIPTPLEENLERLGKALTGLILGLCFVVFVLGIINGRTFYDMFLIVVSLAVSAIPEGLPAIVTATLAIGTQQMAKRKAIMRKLEAIETLGSVSVIVSDKTGTITENEMTVRQIYTENFSIKVTGGGYEPEGEFYEIKHGDVESGRNPLDVNENKELTSFIKTAVLCNSALLQKDGKEWEVIGDPTEGALLVLAEKAKLGEIKSNYEFAGEIPFTSKRKRMSVIYKQNGIPTAYVKGAPEVILRRCKNIYDNGNPRSITEDDRITITQQVNDMTSNALRVLMLAYKDLKPDIQNITDEDVEQELTYLGIVGMIDPPREEVKPSISTCHQAGIRVVMNTGDHLNTAMAVSKEIGLVNETSKVITGKELEQMDDAELDLIINDVSVVARVSPEHKVRILTALKRQGHIVAMTGDGVNDAPALKSADVGISMGLNGTEVAKEASHMVLADDNFASIVNAVEEGRSIFDNIRKFIRYLISANLDELMVVGLALILGWPLPFLPIQILWINLITDGPPALALGIDPKEKDIMQRPPRDPKENVLRSLLAYSFIAGFLAFIATIYVFSNQFFIIGVSLNRARTMAFTTTMIFEMILVFSIREENHSMFSHHSFENKYLILAVLMSFVLQLVVIYVPIMQVIFETEALHLFDWILMAGLCFVLVTILDIFKLIYYKRKTSRSSSQSIKTR